ncbi:hypothetical protein ED92_13200 [Amycolatopsis sp. MJM2582]|uniref:PE domain-containing protein n=1 Tax=Amycolatopsis keratiniphila subsp. keratiniphila TaxID=227715 RepID=A0A1W2LP18_9PSEU|nr:MULTISPECIES: hypothetical protein [Amycolatopsis]KFZ81237.1 hypothetical protein ED92_13200 [Amycolatopsis sp. MJM2582]ONF64997.1 hypothetical protein AVR91_0228060 [Amycolatopsis keratiniphila subsp. keratiniphila]RSN46288.1 hypothetical protein DMC64_16300 [Amycolatopsis sp. WAC 04197]
MNIIGDAASAIKAVWGDLTTPKEPTVYGGGGGGGGGFEMSPEELKTVIGLWQDELKKVSEDGMKIEDILADLSPPGRDEASSSYVDSGVDSLLALQKQNDSMKEYITGYIAKLEIARTKTMVTDQANTMRTT